jgi:predicted ABC-type ATPase
MNGQTKRQIEIVAGPNGSGKSTFAKAFFKLQNGHSRFINADSIATGLSAGNEQQAAFRAGRVMLSAIAEAVKSNETFAFESTLSGKNWIKTLEAAKQNNYEIVIYFVFLEKVSLNVQRIRQRVKEGGHDIPRGTILRRYSRSFENFWKIYRPLCDNWFIFDNTGSRPKEFLSKLSFENLSSEAQNTFEDRFFKMGKVR